MIYNLLIGHKGEATGNPRYEGNNLKMSFITTLLK